MDNGASFIGDLIHSRHFSRVMKLCLHLRRRARVYRTKQAMDERYNRRLQWDFGEKLWEREQWTDPKHIRREAKTFLMRHNNRQDRKYRKIDPEAIPHRKLVEDFEIGADSLPITEEKAHFIRQVKEDGTISVLNEDFGVRELLGYEYVRATVDMKLEQLKGCYWEKNGEEASFIEIYGYKISENVKRFEETF